MNDRKKEPVGALKGQKAWERVTCVVQNIYIKLKEKRLKISTSAYAVSCVLIEKIKKPLTDPLYLYEHGNYSPGTKISTSRNKQ